MTKSPLQFAQDFVRLQGQLAALSPGDGQLLLALDFWQEMREHLGDAAYQSYFDEYLPLLMRLSDKGNLIDLTIAELTRLRDVLADFDSEKSQMVAAELAKQYFYVGAIEEGLAELGASVGQNPLGFDEGGVDEVSSPRRRGTNSSADEALDSRFRGNDRKRNVGQNPLGFDSVGQNEFVALQTLCARATEQDHPLAATLNGILNDWQGEREAVYHDRARCLFVERDDSGRSVRGRLRTLVGKVDLFGKSARTDEITFDNVIKTPDDPFVGVAYSALAAVRKQFGGGASVGQNPRGFDRGGDTQVGREPRAPDSGVARGAGAPPLAVGSDMGTPPARVGLGARMSKPQGFRPTVRSSQASHFYHAHYSIEDSGQTFTGDSIGLAFALVAYVQLLRPEVLRLDRLLSGEVAFTGGVDADGRLTAVNDETLGQKIERAFFSPVKYVVLPEANAATAKQHLDRLRELYPRRNLHLIAAERLSDAIEDHNIVRSEKVCIGEFVAKKAAKYGRMTKVQVPLLLVLAYLLLCLIYPKAWVGFDWNPGELKISGSTLLVYNGDERLLWSRNFDCEIDTQLQLSNMALADIDNDGKNEVAIIPYAKSRCAEANHLFLFSSNGDSILSRSCKNFLDSTCDSTDAFYESPGLWVVETAGELRIVTVLYMNASSRVDIKIWNPKGKQLGWYVNWGGCAFVRAKDSNDDGTEGFWFKGYNNRMGCSCIFVLRDDSSRGISPPFEDSTENFGIEQRGNQLAYILFPVTDVGVASLSEEFNSVDKVIDLSATEFEVVTVEGPNYWVYYDFDHTFRIQLTFFSNQFIKQRETLVQRKLLPAISWDAYADNTANAVLHWVGGNWITERQLRKIGR